MIVALARDALRQLLRGRALAMIAFLGVLIGLFVRATRATGSEHLHAADLRGATLDTWIATLFLAALLHAVVAGLLLAGEDRETGLLQQVAVRPVARLRYAAGRMLGLLLGLASALLMLTLLSAPLSGLSRRDLPEIRRHLLAERVTLDGRELDADEPARIARGSVASFAFDARARPEAELKLRETMVKVLAGGGFGGRVQLQVSYAPAAGARIDDPPVDVRPLQWLPIRFRAPNDVPFALELRVLGDGYLLEVDRESLVVLGPTVSFVSQIVVAWLLLFAAAATVAAISFLLGVGLSFGPASLAGGFVLVIGLSRQVVLDIVAGIGRSAAGGDDDVSLGGRFVRGFLNVVIRLVPDLGRFNPSDVLGAAEALRPGPVLVASSAALATVAACGLLAAWVLPLRER